MRLQRLYELQDLGKIEVVPFFYSAPFLSGIASTVTSTVNVPIQSDSHFLCRYLTSLAYEDDGGDDIVTTTQPPLLINLFDTSSGRTLLDNPQPIQNLTGDGNLPFVFPEPWLIRAGGQVQVTLQNIGGDDFSRVDVTLVGMKIFQFGSQLPPDLRNI